MVAARIVPVNRHYQDMMAIHLFQTTCFLRPRRARLSAGAAGG
jgi:hypothetical protein